MSGRLLERFSPKWKLVRRRKRVEQSAAGGILSMSFPARELNDQKALAGDWNSLHRHISMLFQQLKQTINNFYISLTNFLNAVDHPILRSGATCEALMKPDLLRFGNRPPCETSFHADAMIAAIDRHQTTRSAVPSVGIGSVTRIG